MQIWRDRLYPFGVVSVLALTGLGLWEASFPSPTIAQPIPDETLGNERSRVFQAGETLFGINGGATRGINLFHSFQDFNVDNGNAVYFINPTGIENIFSRVTGNNPSNILGTLGVFGGNANLFFMNPNGIVFGPNARLDVQGSFIATTADAIEFGTQGMFSAIDPQAPPLLTVNPSAFFFNQINPSGIINNSVAPAGTSPSGIPLFGLRVPDGQSLLFVGGDIAMNGGRLNASGGRIELGGLAEPGAIGLEIDGAVLSLSFPDDRTLANLSLGNDTVVAIPGSGGGNIIVNVDTFTASGGGRLVTVAEGATNGGDIEVNANTLNFTGTGFSGNGSGVISLSFPNTTGRAGDVIVNAGSIVAQGGGGIVSVTAGAGDAGSVRIIADTIELIGLAESRQFVSSINSETNPGSSGTGGDVSVSTRVLQVRDGAIISVSTRGTGQGGTLRVEARERAELSGSAVSAQGQRVASGLFATTFDTGQGGSLEFSGGQLLIRDGAAISAATFGAGNAGNVRVTADTIELVGLDESRQAPSGIGSETNPGSSGTGGDVSVSTRVLQVRDGATVSVNTFGAGQGGTLRVEARERAELSGTAVNAQGQRVVSGLGAITFGGGQGGSLEFEGGQLLIRDGAVISATTFGTGDAGSVSVTADTIELVGLDESRQAPSSIASETNPGSSGTGGDVSVSARVLQVRDGATVSVSTRSTGQGGTLQVEARERAELSGTAIDAQGQRSASGLFATTFDTGQGGSLEFSGGQLLIRDGAVISAATFGAGNAGNVRVTADTIELVGLDESRQAPSGIGSETNPGSSGTGGDVSVSTRVLQVRDGATVSVNTFGAGQGGTLRVEARERAELSGTAVNAQGQRVVSGLGAITFGGGQGGSLEFEGGQLLIRDGAVISAATFGTGDAGNVRVIADTIELIGVDESRQIASGIGSETNTGSSGTGGDVSVSTRVLQVRDGATVSVNTFGAGQGGTLRVEARERAELSGTAVNAQGQRVVSGLGAITFGGGQGGSLEFEGGQLLIRDGAVISATTFGTGDAGSVSVTADTIELVGLDESRQAPSSIASETNPGSSGTGGDVSVSARVLQVRDGATVSVSTRSTGQGGTLQVEARERAELSGTAIDAQGQRSASGLFATTFGTGDGGSLEFSGGQLLIRDGAVISAATLGAGDAGSVSVTADTIELVGLDESRQGASSIASETNLGSTGSGGSVVVSARQLNIRNGAAISTSTRGPGNAGNLRITVEESAILSSASVLSNGQLTASGLFASTTSSGNAGQIRLRVGQLILRNGGIISTVTGGSGQAGDIMIRADDSIRLAGTGGNENSIITSSITSSVAPGSTGNAGNIQLQARNLSLRDGGQISAVVSRESIDLEGNIIPGGRGNGGNIRLNIADSITLSGVSDIGGFSSGILTLTERGALGNAGDISIRTGNLRITDGAIVTASTFNPGESGDIDIRAANLELLNGGQIVTSTRNRNNAGQINLNITESTLISGVDPNFSDRRNRAQQFTQTPAGRSQQVDDIIVNQGQQSGIFANTEADSTGDGGSIRLSTTNLQLTDRARISAQSQGTGEAGGIVINARENVTLSDRAIISTQSQGENAQAGDIQITAGNTFSATNSDITTSAANASGGNITLQASDIRLFGDSDILTNSAIDGGNITLRANSILAFGDSDIIAAAGERGGNITLDTPVFFGSGFTSDSANADPDTLDGNDRVDINASGQVSSGNIFVPDTNFIQDSLADLPESAIDTESLIAASCVVRSQDTEGTFIITGRGGLPERPGEGERSVYATGEVRSIPETSQTSWQMGDPIVEPQGLYQLEDGRMVLSQECD
ncbi:two-partner secretion domain-containing protein [Egbenema bharatensis]|uniref:two-partner secretion domain-containing protein n=1 Tax=Egbenema bharatensis TaxID=3463334 RepID=UPI003A8BB155